HRPLHLRKTASLLAMLDNRLHISPDDSQLAHTIWETSVAVRDTVAQALQRHHQADENARIAYHARPQHAAEAARHAAPHAVQRVAATIARALHKHQDPPDDGWAARDLRRHVAGRNKHLFDAAVDAAITNGWITETDGRYRLGESRPA